MVFFLAIVLSPPESYFYSRGHRAAVRLFHTLTVTMLNHAGVKVNQILVNIYLIQIALITARFTSVLREIWL